jgi:hypothetical protein
MELVATELSSVRGFDERTDYRLGSRRQTPTAQDNDEKKVWKKHM